MPPSAHLSVASSLRVHRPADAPNPPSRAIGTCTAFLHRFGTAPATAFDLCTEDAKWYFNRALPADGMGKDDMVSLHGRLFQKLEMSISDAWARADGARVAIECTSDGILKHGEVYRNSYAFHFRLNGEGKIEWVKEHADSVYVGTIRLFH